MRRSAPVSAWAGPQDLSRLLHAEGKMQKPTTSAHCDCDTRKTQAIADEDAHCRVPLDLDIGWRDAPLCSRMTDEETDVSEVAQQCEEIRCTNDAHPALDKMGCVAAMDAGTTHQ